MIGFSRVTEPDRYQSKARVPGMEWLRNHPNASRPRDYWSAFKSDLAKGFRNLCAYSVMYEPVGTVDHFVSVDEDISLSYEWSNLRFAAAWINSCKGKLASSSLLDPFEVGDGWFEIILPSLQLVVTDRIPSELTERAKFVLERLHLRDDERIIRQRQEWYRLYKEGHIDLVGLRRMAPLIAVAVEKQSGGGVPQR